MRLTARAAARADLPVKTTQGFNPRPKLSLALPRPVGVASRCELLLIECTRQPDPQWPERFHRQLPAGMEVLSARPLPPGPPPRVRAATYELPLEPAEAAPAAARVASLVRQERWEVTRRGGDARRRKRKERQIDIKPAVRDLAVVGGTLVFTLLHAAWGSARCEEVLSLVGFTGEAGAGAGPFRPCRQAVAGLLRTSLECDFQPTRPSPRKPEK